ncbi:Carboxy-terminal domain (CTD) phosphatase [Blyttiomyces sp. JEL0837]|nr:Carboxy-terminal domain (CTD) phosphatase [Blyttiomyces sp. JEL0837]
MEVFAHHEESAEAPKISMTHDSQRVLVSKSEASRLEAENTSRLLKEQRLSLILDLDQTVIHASVDPTIDSLISDPLHAEMPAVSEVHKFVLPDSPVVYYIKLRLIPGNTSPERPGTKQFLEKIRSLYELHIYTMGTRNYARAVANVIDPEGHLFQDRILSRDESGSFQTKSIQRLFPCDQSMVVVVDDRGDIWHWPPNLIRIRPYEFFVGTKDINEPIPQTADPAIAPISVIEELTVEGSSENGSVKVLDGDGVDEVTKNKEKGKETVASSVSTGVSDMEVDVTPPTAEEAEEAAKAATITAASQATAVAAAAQLAALRRQRLHENDNELEHVGDLLQKVHETFFEQLKKAGGKTGNKADVSDIMTKMRRGVFSGVRIVFSSVIPVGLDPTRHESWNLGLQYGAKCFTDLNPTITHVVAAKAPDRPAGYVPPMDVGSSENDTLDEALEAELKELDDAFEPEVEAAVRLGAEDWLEMDNEVDEAMNESGDEDDEDDDDGDGDKGDEEGSNDSGKRGRGGGNDDEDEDYGKEDEVSSDASRNNDRRAGIDTPQSLSAAQSDIDDELLDLELEQSLQDVMGYGFGGGSKETKDGADDGGGVRGMKRKHVGEDGDGVQSKR